MSVSHYTQTHRTSLMKIPGLRVRNTIAILLSSIAMSVHFNIGFSVTAGFFSGIKRFL